MADMDNIAPFRGPSGSQRNILRVSSARIDEVSRERNTTFVTISYNNCAGCAAQSGRVRLVVNQDTVIHDERGRNMRAGELQRGMTVDARFSSAMTRSIPPQSEAFYIQVRQRASQTITTIGRIAEVNTRNNFIIVLPNQNLSSTIRFNISPSTIILDLFGRRISLSSLRPGFRVRVEHSTAMTASIPPQSSAFTVQMMR